VVEATDSFGAVARTSTTVRVDNHAPIAPSQLSVDGGTGWRAGPARSVSWANPSQQHAPIAALHYRLRPAGVDSAGAQLVGPAKAACVAKQLTGAQLAGASADIELPTPGLWSLRVWLVDAAGNANPDAATVVGDLGFDPTPPQVVGFTTQDPADPTRVTVAATDDVAPLADGAIEYQRRGTRAWRPLKTHVAAGGITAVVNDEQLRRGGYRLRATVSNAAGLQQGTTRSSDGAAKTIQLPIRLGTRVTAGRRVGRVCRRANRKR
jgi:hypothetical protein